jgi:outer membrane immunogenic protein
MKRLIATQVILWLLCALTLAGPEAFSGKEMKQVAPAPVPPAPCNWTGFYVGGNVGGAFEGNADVTLDLGGAWRAFPEPTDASFIAPFGSRDLSASGVVAGGFLGYNYQWHSFVFGAEASVDYVGLQDSVNSGLLPVSPGTGSLIGDRHSYETNYRVTVGPRVGYAVDRCLLYATGGLAIGDLKYSQTIVEPESPFTEKGSTDDTRVGWTVGGGVQYCITQHWSAKVEYRYTDLGCTDFSTAATEFGLPSTEIFTAHHEACLTFHSVTAGLAYKF